MYPLNKLTLDEYVLLTEGPDGLPDGDHPTWAASGPYVDPVAVSMRDWDGWDSPLYADNHGIGEDYD